MKPIIRISKLFQIFIILCFFLPFVKSCTMGSLEEELDAKRQDSIRIADSLSAIQQQIDSAKNTKEVLNDSVRQSNEDQSKLNINNFENANLKRDTINENIFEIGKETVNRDTSFNIVKNKNLKKNFLTDSIIKNSNFIKPILRPNDDRTGVGYIVDWFPEFVCYFGVYIAFILLLQGMILKLINYSKYYFVFLTGNIVGLLFLFLFEISPGSESFLWGYWTCICSIAFIIIGDIMIKFKYRFELK